MSQQGERSWQSQPEFARRLRALRLARGLTQRGLAGDSLSVSYISLLESGRRTPTTETLQTLAKILSCTPAELTGEQDLPAARPAALTIRLGQVALEAGDPDQAQQHFDEVLAIPDLNPMLYSEAAISAARVLEGQGRLAEAAAAYESLVKQAIDAPTYLASLTVVIRWCRCLYEMGELDRVVEVGMEVMQQLDRLQAWQSDAAIQLLSTVAAAHFELGDIGQAERLLREGLQRADEMHSPKARASVLWNASHLAAERGQHRQALELAEEALAYFRQDSDRRSAARLLSAYGYLLLRQEPPRLADATAALDEALEILSDVGLGYDRGSVLTELSRARLMQGDPLAAEDTARQALAELGPEALLERARAETALAAALTAKGENDESGEIFARAARTLGELKASRQAARAWVELGNTLMDAGDPVSAVHALRQAAAVVNVGAVPSAPTRTLPAKPA